MPQKPRAFVTRYGAFKWARANGFALSRARLDIAVATGALPVAPLAPRAFVIDVEDLRRFLERERKERLAADRSREPVPA